MGLFSRRSSKLPVDAVDAEASVLAMGPTARGARQTGRLDVEYEFRLSVRGAEVTHVCVVPHDRMPLLCQTVPVRVSAADPSRLAIQFDSMPSLTDRARASAAAAQGGDSAAAARALGFEPRPPDG